MRYKGSCKNLMITAVVILIALFVCELAVRIVYGGRFARRPGFYISDPILGYRPAPGLDDEFYGADFSIDIRTDPEGFRLGELGAVDYGREIVLFCGDSYVFGWGVSTGESCASKLDALLDQRSAGSARLVNLGVGGYGTWQTAFRLERFLGSHPDARIAAVIFVHVTNDPCDNAIAIGYPLRVRRTVDRKQRNRSWSHLINMAVRARDGIGAESSPTLEFRGRQTETVMTETSERALEDVLFAFDRVETSEQMPDEAVLGGRRIDIAGLSRPDDMIGLLLEREEMTRIQRDLVREAVNHTHFLLRERGLKLFHIVLPTSPDWFAGEMADLLGRTIASDWNEIVMAGRYPDVSGFTGDVFNDHGGGHYTAEFNAFWARRIMELLEANNVGSWSESSTPR